MHLQKPRVVIASHPDWENLYAEVWYGDDQIAELTIEPPDAITIVVFPTRGEDRLQMPYDIFSDAIFEARNGLLNLYLPAVDVTDYVQLVELFIAGLIPSSEFETRYLAKFKSDGRNFPPRTYELLNGLFTDIDVCVEDETIRRDYEIGPDELLANAKRVAVALKKQAKSRDE